MSRYLPKSIVCFRGLWDRRTVINDCLAGLTVGIIALPLAMAFGIASIPESVAQQTGISPPALGLFTAVVAGFLISALGGSRVQIGGPTGAFVIIVYGVVARHGYEGLAVATILAGLMTAGFGFLRLGNTIRFIPYPVTTGFTAGIAVVIFSTQIKDFFGLSMSTVPVEFLEKCQAYFYASSTFNPAALGVGFGSLGLMLLLRRFAPRVPGAIVAVVTASAAVALLGLQVETIGSRFGGIPNSLPLPHLPHFNLQIIREVLPEAMTIAVLASIESLLSAVVADGMIGGRHKADCELVAQGIANIASALFGGIPATGAIARTAANVKSGGRTPLAGMVHAAVLLGFMLLAAPLAKTIPLPTLAAVLMIVAWNMSEIEQVKAIFRSPKSDILVLAATFGLTVFADLTLAVGVGMVLAAMLFMRRMSEVSFIRAVTGDRQDSAADELADLKDPNSIDSRHVPPGVEVYEISGPLFFGSADRLRDVIRNLERKPKIFILRMRKVSTIDASGLHALRDFHRNCRREGAELLLSGVHAQPLVAIMHSELGDELGSNHLFGGIDDALNHARALLGLAPHEKPPTAEPEVARERERRDMPIDKKAA
jgi:sulfate permease, SulP family